MGQAQLERPGSSEGTGYAKGETPAADDLLAQIAGDEIDRMLSEADIETDVPPGDAPVPPPPRAPILQEAPAQALRSSATPPVVVPAPSNPPAPASPPLQNNSDSSRHAAPPAEADPATAASLDDIFAQLAAGDPSLSATAAPAANAPSARREAATSAPAPAPSESVTQAAINAVEADRFAAAEAVGLLSELQSGTSAQAPSAAPASEPAQSHTSLDDLDDDIDQKGLLSAPLPDPEINAMGASPWYVRPLEWLNSPLASCPDAVREVLGKVAIITAVNALAVLIYVLFFRRP